MKLNLGPKIGVERRRPSVEAAGKVALASTKNPIGSNQWGVGISRLTPAEFPIPPVEGIWSREAAMSVPTISRARDLICTAVGALPITLWSADFSLANPVETQMPPPTWALRPDPNRTRQFTLAWTADDLLFMGRAHWRIKNRYASTYPSEFEWMPEADVHIDVNGKVTYLAKEIPAQDVVEFLSPIDGLLFTGWRTIATALNLENAANRFSTVELPAGWLEQTENSEPLDATELAEIATDFQAARASRTVAALNPYLRWRESQMDPSRLQLTEARAHQALELSRLANIPAYLVGAPAGTGMTYANAAQAKSDLIDFGALPYVQCIEQTLSGPNVTPRGQFVRLATDAWTRSPFTPSNNADGRNDAQIAFNPSDTPVSNGQPGRPRQFDGQNEGVPQ